MTDDGYQLNAIYYFSDIEVAVERAQRSAEETGRSVPEAIIRTIQQNLIRDMAQHASNFQRTILVDSTDIENPRIMLDISRNDDERTGSTNSIDEDLLIKYWPGIKWWTVYDN